MKDDPRGQFYLSPAINNNTNNQGVLTISKMFREIHNDIHTKINSTMPYNEDTVKMYHLPLRNCQNADVVSLNGYDWKLYYPTMKLDNKRYGLSLVLAKISYYAYRIDL
jgi:hypothetical protein